MAGKRIQEVSLPEVEHVAHSLARKFFDWGEPIPAFITRYPDKLESYLATPFQKFGGKSLYSGMYGKASILFYLMVKNHPFQNGNKRVAVMTLLFFLEKNGWWIRASNDELYEFARQVAISDREDRTEVMRAIEAFMRRHLYKEAV